MQSDLAVSEKDVGSGHLTIAEMSRLCNVSLRTLRFYEQIGLITPIRVRQSRLYSPRNQMRLHLIITGKKLGFSLREISNMLRSHAAKTNAEPNGVRALLDLSTIQRQLSLLEEQRADIEDTIKELRAALPDEPSDQNALLSQS